MVKMDNVVRCYRGIDPVDGLMSRLIVKNNETAATFDCDDAFDDLMNGSRCFESYISSHRLASDQRLAALDQFELLWEKQE